ncbi:TIR domain-containing protein [Acetoanaerobium noterae]|uniref:TIR domain-containing protein n=1 Tax=Acetoanaerobium noterae TaxID=745369 RepID=A0A1T5AHH5_9FIRM|nr:TIR domain-containing protein [Acetoanaerobium noterae]SKB34309.1 TIR domain-containing protein [Acetoanaerobium noterae]
MKVFLSHSSSDKDHYVRVVSKKMERDRIIYDEYTFEEGVKSIEEIDRGLNSSDLFVVFLSENSLNSHWVKYELFKANTLLTESSKLERIFPIIIDNRIKHDDKRIPDWLRENNLKVVISPNKAVQLIHQRLIEMSFSKHPKLAEKNRIFVGRNDVIEEFEMRINDFRKKVPAFIIASGLPTIGRKKVIYHSWIKTDTIKYSYIPPIINLDSHESIEDFVFKLCDLGLTERRKIEISISTPLEVKVGIAAKLLYELRDEHQRVFINDNGCIITHSRELVGWFKDLYEKVSEIGYMVIGIASKYRVYEAYQYDYENIMFSHIEELSKSERERLFYRYLQLEDLELLSQDVDFFVGLLKGYPEQTMYASQLIKQLGVAEAKRKSHLIVDYNTDRVVEIIKEYSEDSHALGILALLSEFGTIGYETFFEVVGNDNANYRYLEEFYAKGICVNIGTNKEYIRLNDIIHDYLIRMSLKLPNEYSLAITKSLDAFIHDYNQDEYIIDLTEYQYMIKRALLENKVENIARLLAPSHYLKTMKELYDIRKNYKDVIILADRVLTNESFIDNHIKQEIRYYLCLALARKNDDRFHQEVRKISGAEHDFLYGFYYRLSGKTDKAIERYEEALSKRKKFARAQRDLVQVYLSIDDFETAYNLAKENYKNDKKSNPFHIHAYFTSLLRNSRVEDKSIELNKLLSELNKNQHNNAEEFYLRCKSQYLAYCENDEKQSIDLINEALVKYPNNHWVLMDKFYICVKFKKINELKKIHNDFVKNYTNNLASNNNTLTKMKIIIASLEGNNDVIPSLISELNYYPERVLEKLRTRYEIN